MALPFFRNDIAGNCPVERDTVRFIRLGQLWIRPTGLKILRTKGLSVRIVSLLPAATEIVQRSA